MKKGQNNKILFYTHQDSNELYIKFRNTKRFQNIHKIQMYTSRFIIHSEVTRVTSRYTTIFKNILHESGSTAESNSVSGARDGSFREMSVRKV